ncbi:MAG: exonuclease, partial [Lachnospiraceae bacterium]|nr:exonuclease [Lachnospiraceae bacterium]
DIDTKGNAHNGMSDAYNTALLFSKMMRNPDFDLNPYYKAAQEPEKGPGLQVSMGDLLKGIKLPGGDE